MQAAMVGIVLTAAASSVKQPFDWTQCTSEGGPKNCAKCAGEGNGALPCAQVNEGEGMLKTCPDDQIFATRKYFVQHGVQHYAMCSPLSSHWSLSGISRTTMAFPGVHETAVAPGGNVVASKAVIAHPHKAGLGVGVAVFKRTVRHLCTASGSCKTNHTVADVMKIGVCISCPEDPKRKYRGEDNKWVFSQHGHNAKDAKNDAYNKQKQDFVNICMPKAFNSTGHLKKKYMCNSKDQELADITIMMA